MKTTNTKIQKMKDILEIAFFLCLIAAKVLMRTMDVSAWVLLPVALLGCLWGVVWLCAYRKCKCEEAKV